jgi:hypothetical protein
MRMKLHIPVCVPRSRSTPLTHSHQPCAELLQWCWIFVSGCRQPAVTVGMRFICVRRENIMAALCTLKPLCPRCS